MRLCLFLTAAALLVAGPLADCSQARERRPRPRHPGFDPPPVDPQKPIEWLTDFDEAARLAAKEQRPLMALVSNMEAERACKSCRFAANPVRRAVRDAKVVAVKVLPPPALDLSGLKPEAARQLQAAAAERRKRYNELVRRFGAVSAPTLVYAAPDATKLAAQAAPSDDDIRAVLGRLGEMVKLHQEAKAKEAKPPEPPAADPKKPEPDKPPAKPGGEDDF